MQSSNFWPYFIFGVVVLHFVIGFGYLAYKMTRKSENDAKKDEKVI